MKERPRQVTQGKNAKLKNVWLMFNLTPVIQGFFAVSLSRCVSLPELGLESLSRWNVPLGSGVGGESRSEGTSQERVDHRELFPLPEEEEWIVPSPELLPQSSGLLRTGSVNISDGEGA